MTVDEDPKGKWRRRTIAKVMAELMDMAEATRQAVYAARRAQMAEAAKRLKIRRGSIFRPYADHDRPGVILCGARTRKGTPCRRLGLGYGWRCSLHGGCSTGPRTPEGQAKARAALDRINAERRDYRNNLMLGGAALIET